MTDNLTKRLYNKYGNTPLTTAICYQLTDPGIEEENIVNIVNYIQTILNIKLKTNLNISDVGVLFIYIYNSIKVLFNLPYMLNTVKNNSKPSLHLFFSETIAQLVSISLSSEALSILNSLCINLNVNNNIKSENYQLLFKNDFKDNEIFETEDTEILKNYYDNQVNSLYSKCIRMCLNFYKSQLETNNTDKLYDFFKDNINKKYLTDELQY